MSPLKELRSPRPEARHELCESVLDLNQQLGARPVGLVGFVAVERLPERAEPQLHQSAQAGVLGLVVHEQHPQASHASAPQTEHAATRGA